MNRAQATRPQSAASALSHSCALAGRAEVISEGKADGVPGEPSGDFVSTRVTCTHHTGPRRSRKAPVRQQRQILYRHTRSRKRDHTRQLALLIGQANKPITALASAGDCASLHAPNSIAERGGSSRG